MLKFIGFYDYTVILTYLSLVSAVFGMIQASNGAYTPAIIALCVCGVCDGFDGTVARTKKNRTDDEKTFGIQIDSLCDVVSFGVFPAFLCYCMGANGILGILGSCAYTLCAVIRLGFFNVLEAKRQQTEGGCNKFYRGLPVTTAAILLPFVYLFHNLMSQQIFIILLHIFLFAFAFLFILDFKVKKLSFRKK